MSIEWANGDAVMFDCETFEYHTLSREAFELWEAADGARCVDELAMLVFGDATREHVLLTKYLIMELTAAGLLDGDDRDAPGFLTRRKAAKLAVVTLLGGVALPVVDSITAPVSADGISPPPPPPKIIPINEQCYSTYATGACVEGTCCCHPASDIAGRCWAPGDCGGACV
jgi:hypothetical protein